MKYLAGYILAQMGGHEQPTAKDIDKILGSVGLDFDAEKANLVVNSLKGKDLQQVIAEGTKKLASVPSGGTAAPAAAAPASAGGGAEKAAAPAKEEKKPEKEESEDEDMGFGLFD